MWGRFLHILFYYINTPTRNALLHSSLGYSYLVLFVRGAAAYWAALTS